jgi:hypothetical protein
VSASRAKKKPASRSRTRSKPVPRSTEPAEEEFADAA